MMVFGLIALGGFLVFLGMLLGSSIASGAAIARMEHERNMVIAEQMGLQAAAAYEAANN